MTNSWMPLKLDTERIELDIIGTGEWEIAMHLECGETLYWYTDMPDPLYDQLFMKDILDVEEVYDA